jgi:hypothetical protein
MEKVLAILFAEKSTGIRNRSLYWFTYKQMKCGQIYGNEYSLGIG